MQRKMKRTLSAILAGCMVLPMQAMPSVMEGNGEIDYTIISPYESVDWDTYGQYKADFHAHSTNSDGGNLTSEMVEDHYAKGFDVLAMTDHNYLTTSWDEVDKGAMTTERMNEVLTGKDRNGRGMTQVGNGNEQSRSNHVNTFWTPFNNQAVEGGVDLESNIQAAETLGGISHINHPGRYTGGRNTAIIDGVDKGKEASDNPENINKYVDLFMKYTSCVGMEIINKKDGDSYSDRILWDNILQQTMPEGRFVWGFSNDDTHSLSGTGFSYNMMLMPENTEANVRASMEEGTFYAVAKYAYRELGREGYTPQGEAPYITEIKVDQQENTITIEADETTEIQWIADGEVIKKGNTIDLNDHEDQVNSYVRANIIGEGGIAFTQPFQIKEEAASVEIEVSKEGVEVGETFEVTIGVKGENRGVYAQDLTLNYDEQKLELMGYEKLNETEIAGVDDTKNGAIRLLVATQGGLVNNKAIKLVFKALESAKGTDVILTTTDTSFGLVDGTTGVAEALNVEDAQKTISVIKGHNSDLTEDGVVDVADLALVAYYYQAKVGDANWEIAKKADVDGSGAVDIRDLTIVAQTILNK